MKKPVTLTQIEASGIQDYIFGSNNLRQNIGASELVARATSEWVVRVLDDQVGKKGHNALWNDNEGQVTFNERRITTPGVKAEVIYAGGGNALILFIGLPNEHAMPFTKALTHRALSEARGLFLVADHLAFDWDADPENKQQALSQIHQDLRQAVAARKLARQPDVPLVGLGVTAACVFSGLPVVGKDDEGRLVSQVVQHKLARSKLQSKDEPDKDKALANYRLYKILPQVGQNGYEFVRDFDLFGEKGESSYIAVIHADGNKMSQRFQAVAGEHRSPEDNAAYAKQLRDLSQAVKDKATTALRATVDLLINSLDKESGKFGGVVPIPWKNGRKHLPFRPIVFGGDDATFVCEGRLGLALATQYLKTMAEGDLPGPKVGERGDPLYARAGVAVVKSHYPFSRAYELAEDLCKSAKDGIRSLTPNQKGIVMDWHFSSSGLVLSLEQLRRREYSAVDGRSLLMRPVRIDLEAPPKESRYWRSWQNFEQVTLEFQGKSQKNSDWAGRRNKILALREALRQGERAVEQFRQIYKQDKQLKLPEIPGQSTMPTMGWQAEDCGYFDPIEALDFYVRLEKEVY